MFELLRKFNKQRSGAVAIIIALSLTVLVGMLLLTINLTNRQSTDDNIQGGADAAALAAAQYLTQQIILNGNNTVPDGKITSGPVFNAVTGIFKGNSTSNEALSNFDRIDEIVITTVGTERQVTVKACHNVRNNYAVEAGALKGTEKTSEVCNRATSLIGKLSGEIVFALDVSASMKQSVAGVGPKITALQTAATQVINNQLAKNNATGTGIIPGVYWGVVPFRGIVDLGNYSGFVQPAAGLTGAQLLNERAYLDSNTNAGGNTILNNTAVLQRIPITQTAADFTDNPSRPIKSYIEHDKDYWFYYNEEVNCNGVDNCRRFQVEYCAKNELVGLKNLCRNECAGREKVWSEVRVEVKCGGKSCKPKQYKKVRVPSCKCTGGQQKNKYCFCGGGYKPPKNKDGCGGGGGGTSNPPPPPPPAPFPSGGGGAAGGAG